MKVLIVSQYFWPEEFRINDLAIDLVKRGYKVTVITGNPNYPKGVFVKGYGFKYLTETYEGITIYRVPIIARGKNSITMILNYVSFAVFGSLFAFSLKEKFDKVFAVNYSPITAVIPAIVYCKKNKVKLSIWVQDLWPESVIAASNIKSNIIQKWLNKLVKYIYKKSDTIFVSNFGFKNSIESKGINGNKIFYMPNWAEDIFESHKHIAFDNKNIVIPEGFIIMFAGNLGESQDFDSIIKAIELTKQNKLIQWVFVGDGRKCTWLIDKIEKDELQETVTMLGRHPTALMPSFFERADVMLVSLKNEYIFSLTVPGKIQSYMASSKPILTMLNGAANDIVSGANCGFVAKAGDFNSLAKNATELSSFSVDELEEMGRNGFEYYQDKFSKKRIVDKFLKIF